jgi:RNA polymerase sigma factor (TIGR02999 family)
LDIGEPNSITRLLLEWRRGDAGALDRLLPLVYEELRSLAGRYMKGERPGHTLQATAVVHEAFTRLINMDVDWQDRAHFFAVAARCMRRVLVDHARARLRDRRGAGATPVSLDEALLVTPPPSLDLVALDASLDRLSAFDADKARAVELIYFGGLSYEEAGTVLGIAPSTVHREVTIARAWLRRDLGGEAAGGA